MTKYLWILAALPFALGCPGDKGDTGTEADTDTDTDTDSDTDGDVSFDVTQSSSGVTLTITNGSGDYEFGMAETDSASSDPWTGEDCLNGYTTGSGTTYAICHEASSTGVVLQAGELGDLCDDCGFTIMNNVSDSVTTYYVISDATGDCWTWGHDTSYYAGLGCTEM